MKVLSYFESAEVSLRSILIPLFDKNGLGKEAELARHALKLGQKSIKFILPDTGKIIDDGWKGLNGGILKLPFPVVLIEYEATEAMAGVGTHGMDASDTGKKRIIIAEEVENGFNLYHMHSVDIYAHSKIMGKWAVLPVCYKVRRNNDNIEFKQESHEKVKKDRLDHLMGMTLEDFKARGDMPDFLVKKLEEDPSLLDKLKQAFPLLAKDLENVPKAASKPFTVKGISVDIEPFVTQNMDYSMLLQMQQDMEPEFLVVMELLEALSCSNVHHTDVKRTMIRNKKTKRMAPVDKYSYKILTIDVTREDGLVETEEVDHVVRDRREHLRRGHIRNQPYKGGVIKKIWINPVIVNKGNPRLDKDYKIIA